MDPLKILILIAAVASLRPITGLATNNRLFKDGRIILGGLHRVHLRKDVNQCGKFYPQGLGRVEAMLYAIDKINQNKSFIPGIKLGYDIRDFCQDQVKASRHAYEFTIASKMADCESVHYSSDYRFHCQKRKHTIENNYTVTKPVAAIVGALISQAAIPLANFLGAVKIPLVDTEATSEELSSTSYNSFFRTIPSDVNQAKAIADVIEHFQWRYVFIAVVDDSYGRHGVKALERESNERGKFYIELLGYIPVSNYRSKLELIVSVLKQRKTVRVVILWTHAFQGRELLEMAANENIRDRVWIFSEALTMVKPVYIRHIKLESTGTHFGVQLPKINSNGYLQYIRSKAKSHNSRDINPWWGEVWAMVDKEKNCSVGCISAVTEMIQDDFVPYIIDAVYTTAHAIHKITQCLLPNGASIEGSCVNGTQNLRPALMIDYIKKVSFQGLTGKVEFDERGDPEEAFYEIVYFNITNSATGQELTKETVGRWDKRLKKRLNFTNDFSIQWKTIDGGIPISTCTEECIPGQFKVQTTSFCWKCLQCPDGRISTEYGSFNCTACAITQMSSVKNTICSDLPIENVKWTDMGGVVIAVFSIVGILFDIIVVIIFVRYGDTPMVKSSNKVYSFVLLMAIALCFGLTLLHIVVPSTGLCYALKPLRYVIYTLCCSALFLKTMQIVHAFNVSSLKDWIWVFICSTKRQILVLVLVLGVEVFLGIAWILSDPPYLKVTIIPKSHVTLTCEPFRKIIGRLLELMLLAYLISLALLCTYYAFLARKLPANFNEAKYICFSLYIFLLSWITYYPLDYALEGWYVAILSGITILLSSYGLLGCIFMPKVYIIIRHPEKNTAEFVRAELRQGNINRSMNNISTGSRGV